MEYSLNGKQERGSTKTSNLKMARKLAEHKNSELILGIAKRPTKPITVFEAAEQYAAARTRKKKSEDTRKIYRRSLRYFAFFAEFHKVRRLQAVSPSLLEKYEHQLETDGLNEFVPEDQRKRTLKSQQPTSVRENLKIVRQLFRWAVKKGLLQEDPTREFELPEEIEREEVYFEPAVLNELRKHAQPFFLDILDFFALTGLRSKELCWLMKDNVILGSRPYINICSKKCPITGKAWAPKFRKERIVPL
jgi:site-specific recombinase XerD